MNRLSLFQELLNSISERGLALLGPSTETSPHVNFLIDQCDALLSNRGEASGVAYARRVLTGFASLDESQHLDFFLALASRYQPDASDVKNAAEAYLENQSSGHLQQLTLAVEPPRQELFRRLNLAPGGTAVLVEMRKSLLKRLSDDSSLRAIDADMAHLLGSWFNRGFLILRRIDWQTSANLLEKLITYEAVHKIDGWEDLQRRVHPADRRCFAFFHPALGEEPLIFVEVALMKHVPGTISEVLDEKREQLPLNEARTAVFYSISNCQDGLRGVSFGNFLIKQVAEELLSELPQLRKFVTLSPIPGFMRWLEGSDVEQTDAMLSTLELIRSSNWNDNETISAQVRDILLPLVAHYLLQIKRPDELPDDPVARFHLGNGASLDRIHWGADLSERGIRQSAGVMVNYLYDLDKIEVNHEAYINRRSIPASRPARTLLGGKRSDARAREPDEPPQGEPHND